MRRPHLEGTMEAEAKLNQSWEKKREKYNHTKTANVRGQPCYSLFCCIARSSKSQTAYGIGTIIKLLNKQWHQHNTHQLTFNKKLLFYKVLNCKGCQNIKNIKEGKWLKWLRLSSVSAISVISHVKIWPKNTLPCLATRRGHVIMLVLLKSAYMGFRDIFYFLPPSPFLFLPLSMSWIMLRHCNWKIGQHLGANSGSLSR